MEVKRRKQGITLLVIGLVVVVLLAMPALLVRPEDQIKQVDVPVSGDYIVEEKTISVNREEFSTIAQGKTIYVSLDEDSKEIDYLIGPDESGISYKYSQRISPGTFNTKTCDLVKINENTLAVSRPKNWLPIFIFLIFFPLLGASLAIFGLIVPGIKKLS